MKNSQPKFILVITAIAIAALFRLIPHWPNFTPMATIALMGGALVANRLLGFIIPLIALFISDVLTVTLINSRWISLEDYFTSPFINFTSFLYIYISVTEERFTDDYMTVVSMIEQNYFFTMSIFT
jgi:hypothetical protein